MIETVNEALELLLAASRDLLSTSELDIGRCQEWAASRQEIFAYLQTAAFPQADGAQAESRVLLDEILRIDTLLLLRLEEMLNGLAREISDTRKTRRALERSRFDLPTLLERFV